MALQNDLALALAAHPIRIEAPIPGKSLVGIEIPNSVKTTVGLGTILASDEYQHSAKPLLVSLGKSIPGKCYFGNMEKMPHLSHRRSHGLRQIRNDSFHNHVSPVQEFAGADEIHND